MGLLNFVSTSGWKVVFSFCKSCCLECTTLVCEYVDHIVLSRDVWWLSHCIYWSVQGGFLHTLVANVPSVWGITSTNGIGPFCLVSSTVNWIQGLVEFICLRNSFFWADLCISKASSRTFSTALGLMYVLSALISKFP